MSFDMKKRKRFLLLLGIATLAVASWSQALQGTGETVDPKSRQVSMPKP